MKIKLTNLIATKFLVCLFRLEFSTISHSEDIIRRINDPEHPLTLEQLNVVKRENIVVDNASETIFVSFTPTIPHCSMATLIGLCLRVKLLRSLPQRFKVDVKITPGTHNSEHAGINNN